MEALLTIAGLFGCTTLIQIAPIKVNPWSALFNFIGNAINKDVISRLDGVQSQLDDLKSRHDKLEQTSERDKADNCRSRILRFADELRRDVPHSEEFFNQILDDITDYERYCDTHPEYKNSKATNAIAKIDKVYQKCMSDNSFL